MSTVDCGCSHIGTCSNPYCPRGPNAQIVDTQPLYGSAINSMLLQRIMALETRLENLETLVLLESQRGGYGK